MRNKEGFVHGVNHGLMVLKDATSAIDKNAQLALALALALALHLGYEVSTARKRKRVLFSAYL